MLNRIWKEVGITTGHLIMTMLVFSPIIVLLMLGF